MQLLTHLLVVKWQADKQAELLIDDSTNIYQNIPNKLGWMSHRDHPAKIAEGFEVIALNSCVLLLLLSRKKILCFFQYHPRVTHSEHELEMLANFVFNVANCEKKLVYGEIILKPL